MVQQYKHIIMVSKIIVEGLRRWWSSSWSNSASKQARDLFFLTPGFRVWGIIWDHFQKHQIDLKAENSLDRLSYYMKSSTTSSELRRQF